MEHANYLTQCHCSPSTFAVSFGSQSGRNQTSRSEIANGPNCFHFKTSLTRKDIARSSPVLHLVAAELLQVPVVPCQPNLLPKMTVQNNTHHSWSSSSLASKNTYTSADLSSPSTFPSPLVFPTLVRSFTCTVLRTYWLPSK